MLSKQENAIRLSIIILDISAQMLREHILHELKRNKFEDLGELFKSPLVSNLLPVLKRFWHINKDNEMPDSIDKLDISKSSLNDHLQFFTFVLFCKLFKIFII